MAKKLNVNGIINELREGSAFFQKSSATPPPEAESADEKTPNTAPVPPDPQASKTGSSPASMPPHKQDNEIAVDENRQHDSMLASYQASMIEPIRKALKSQGKEVSFVRLTEDEKTALADIVYTYRRQKVKTSENEINRIAINFLIRDYEEHGEGSILAQVIAAINA